MAAQYSIAPSPAGPKWTRAGCRLPPGHTGRVGLNPFQARRRSALDYVFVAAALVVCAALLAWALVG